MLEAWHLPGLDPPPTEWLESHSRAGTAFRAPALTAADLGVAMGSGTGIAVEAGDVVLMSADPRAVVTALSLAGATFRTIRQNLFWAFFYNSVAIPVAALGLLRPSIAAAAMALSSVSVVVNSLRLRRFGRDLA